MAARLSLIGYPAALLLLGALLALSGGSLMPSDSVPGPMEEGLGLLASLTGLALLGWWTVSLALAFAAEGLRRQGHAAAAAAANALTPAFMRRLAAALLGANLLAVPAGGHTAPPAPAVQAPAPAVQAPAPAVQAPAPAAAGLELTEWVGAGGVQAAETGDTNPDVTKTDGSQPGSPQEHPGATRLPRVSPEWVPLPVPCGPGLLARESLRQPGDRSGEVVVRPGDSLWSIAATRLGPLASDAEIAGHWPHWYTRNASVIGPDPGLLRPGQVLRAPERS